MRTYRRIAYEDRCQIYAVRKAGKTQAEIGQALGFSQGTVSRELARNAGWRGYRFQQAQRSAQARQQQIRRQPRTLTSRVRRAIARKLRAERWSPEQISFWLRAERGLSLSHEWIYQMIWADKRTGGDLWRFLRRRGTRDNRRGAQHAGRGVIPHRIDIAERPAIVTAKSRLGDWEGDTIVGARHQGGLLTHVERKSLFTIISKLSRPTAQATHRATVQRLKPLRHHGHTTTYDNGKEFAGHRSTAQCLHAHVFFATPPITRGNVGRTRTRMV
jgi:transposase, IS30 family